MLIDSHVHVWTEPSDQYPQARTPPRPSADAELLLTHMQPAGVAHAVLVQPSFYGFDNRYLIDTLRRYPGRFATMGMIDVRAPAALDQFSHLVNDGLQGLRLMPLIDADLLTHPGTHAVWEHAAHLNVALSLYVAPRHMPQITALVRDFPNTRVIVEHIGRPDDDERDLTTAIEPFLELAPFPSVYTKLTGLPVISRDKTYPYADTFPLIRRVWEKFGSQRMLWGSDFPGILNHCTYADVLALVQHHLPFLTAADRDYLLGGTAQTLFRFEG